MYVCAKQGDLNSIEYSYYIIVISRPFPFQYCLFFFLGFLTWRFFKKKHFSKPPLKPEVYI